MNFILIIAILVLSYYSFNVFGAMAEFYDNKVTIPFSRSISYEREGVELPTPFFIQPLPIDAEDFPSIFPKQTFLPSKVNFSSPKPIRDNSKGFPPPFSVRSSLKLPSLGIRVTTEINEKRNLGILKQLSDTGQLSSGSQMIINPHYDEENTRDFLEIVISPDRLELLNSLPYVVNTKVLYSWP